MGYSYSNEACVIMENEDDLKLIGCGIAMLFFGACWMLGPIVPLILGSVILAIGIFEILYLNPKLRRDALKATAPEADKDHDAMGHGSHKISPWIVGWD